MHFLFPLILSTLTTTTANPIYRQSLNQTITITDLTVEIIRENFADNASFIIQTPSSNITCGGDGILPLPTSCNSDQDWQFILVSDEFNDAVNLTVSVENDGVIVSGETAITLFCRGIPGAVVETENCVALHEVESGGLPNTIALEIVAEWPMGGAGS